MSVSLSIFPCWERSCDPVGSMDPELFTDRHDRIPIEGVGVVHVVTAIPDDDPGYAFTDIVVVPYAGGRFLPPAPVAGSVCTSPYALSMHTHWSELGRVIRCLQGDHATLSIVDIDWEMGDELDDDDPEDNGDPRDHPGYTPWVQELVRRALGRGVRIPDLGGDVDNGPGTPRPGVPATPRR